MLKKYANFKQLKKVARLKLNSLATFIICVFKMK